jgi:eukaryotic-like serine/threonine-protein kinase
MSGAQARPSTVRFGPFELNNARGELRKAGISLKLQPQPLRVLSLLVERAGQIVGRGEIQRTLWGGDTFVDFDRSINFCVNQIRVALGDDAEKPRYIETLPRRGYRFIAPVRDESFVESAAAPVPVPVVAGRSKWLLVGSFFLAGLAIGLFWFARRTLSTPREPITTQLTANSLENPVTSSAISPNGKYLAFTDNLMRMRVRLLATGETQTIPEPQSLQSSPVDWSIVGWFPDGTRFIANALAPRNFTRLRDRLRFLVSSHPANGLFEPPNHQERSIWIVSILGGAPQKLREDAEAFSVSPGGSLIAFGANPNQLGDGEVWLMDARGQEARKLYDTPGDTAAFAGLNWSPDGKRVIYFKFGESSGELLSRALKGGPATTLVPFSNQEELIDFVSLPDGRVIYARVEDLGSRSCNFWELRIDPRSGQPVEKPRPITNWTGFCVGGPSVTADGKHLAFHRWARQTTVNVADIEANGTRVSSARRLTLNEYVNAAETWTPDSKALVFRSFRDGHMRLFKQALDADLEESLVMGAEDVGGSAISPDGSWLFYLDCGVQGEACDGPVPVTRIPFRGGTPHPVLTAYPYGRPRCAVSPATLCAVAEQSEDGKPLVFTAFDALNGRGPELARFETEQGDQYAWALSPDGTQIAILKSWDSRIHVLSLKGQPPRHVDVKGGGHFAGIYWTADGKGWVTASKKQLGTVLLHVDLQGKSDPLWELKGDTIAYGLPSPDGRHLAIVATARSNNVWLLENF